MSKAEERAQDLGYRTDPLNRAEYTANEVREAFIDGYEKAEKDLKLTWEDIRDICSIQYIVLNEYNDYDEPSSSILYQEVLKRFNKERNK